VLKEVTIPKKTDRRIVKEETLEKPDQIKNTTTETMLVIKEKIKIGAMPLVLVRKCFLSVETNNPAISEMQRRSGVFIIFLT
jgi:hypothetical protein